MNTERVEIKSILNKITNIFDYITNYAEIHEKYLKELLIKYDYEDILSKNLMLSEFHVIDCIGKNQLPNATFISKELDMTRGGISKITAKLIEKNLIKGNHLENNKKEIYYTLTTEGKKAFRIHKELHEIESRKFVNMLNRYNNEKLNIINKFLDDLMNNL
ncbi:MarR family transcriptional regulator [Clostridium luticellarii]|jgi:DNA-binding MarR family transcriptional regulator|uniref:MarR family protein n=1 Tax=Clostridium luticellarii TaxID=1691940 RepID=A0A2T0B6R0_9CLOT|nr:MarR family transcriptional regulator [Clostridium luticellarii]MCI1945739.1 MarR family transcriptional regulator [Clostridium luticellarii]MCI1969091.1 MarR family transcriptional regulator [Clostridium luticellarii]MCI1996319.1 MarR family transcriptional regulator [Clostridium luticellarii]MCI2040646.1 MarR family transcriptional regulator [Clostridium luticellarii]PRR79579.1 MarR family protein [Clostridium luticellarii]